MAAVIASVPKFQFNSALGVPLVNGTLTTYLAGTSTLVTTYQDQALTIANANPIVLDSRGECILWLDSTKNYKFVLANSAAVVQWTVDNVTNTAAFAETLNTQLRADLAASTGAALVGSLQTGTGAISRSVQNKLREVFSVLDFGADPTGVADSYSAIVAGITAINTAGGGRLTFPKGTYRVNSSITIPRGVALIGSARGGYLTGDVPACGIKYYGTGQCFLIQGSTSDSKVEVKYMNIDGTNAAAGASGVYLDGTATAVQDVLFEGVSITNFPVNQVLQNGTVFDITFRDCGFSNYARASGSSYKVGLLGVPGQLTFDHCFFINVTAATWAFESLNGNCDARFIGGTVGPSSATGNGIYALGSLYVAGTHIEGFTAGTGKGIQYKGSGGAHIAPALLFSFGIGVQIGDGTTDAARGWNILGQIGANTTADVLITPGAVRNGVIGNIGNYGGAPIITDQRLTTDGVAEVFNMNGNASILARAFTPTLTGGTLAGVTTYTNQLGTYCLEGRVCTFTIYISWTAVTGTGQAIIGGLPFNSLTGTFTPVSNFRYENFAIGAANALQAFISAGTKTFALETRNTAGGAAASLTIPASGSLMIQGSYIIG